MTLRKAAGGNNSKINKNKIHQNYLDDYLASQYPHIILGQVEE